ncbi:MAG: hypothetical protein KA765_14795 [Thermoflexales bacterium]|nr:hypothetical protein [Thermoflexales bacterium]
MKIRLLLLTLSILLTACAPATSVSPLPAPVSPVQPPTRDTIIEPIQIDQVEIRIAESFPVQVFAHVTGVIGDGCSSVLPAEQKREGNTVTVTINRQRPAEAMCTQIAKLYDENIRLSGDFPPGEYTLKVNAVTQTFTVN